MKQFALSPASGKRLIARALVAHPAIQPALRSCTVAIIAGTTNGYVAEEILAGIGQSEGFSRRRFFRGIVLSPRHKTTGEGRLTDESAFPGDVIIEKGVWQKGKTIFDVIDGLKEGDVVLKGANALDLGRKQAALAGRRGACGWPCGATRSRSKLRGCCLRQLRQNQDSISGRIKSSSASTPRRTPAPSSSQFAGSARIL